MPETLTMSRKETERLKVISRIEHNELTVAEAAESLQVSERQLYRILKRYRRLGEQGLIHRLRGCPSNACYQPEIRTKAIRLYREQYSDYGPTLFAEKLEHYHSLSTHAHTLVVSSKPLGGNSEETSASQETRTPFVYRFLDSVRWQ